MRAVFIRHGQSTGNVGIPCEDLALLELTELGWEQARELAEGWIEVPDLIVTSPYLRAQQTAAPTMKRFPEVPVEVWPIQEFTYLQPGRWNGTLSIERMPFIEQYWGQADPEYCDGAGAESFSSLLERAQTALQRLASYPTETLIYLFSHGQFMQAVRSLVTESNMSNREKMSGFWGKGSQPISNGELIRVRKEGTRWEYSGSKRL
ncbi:histidine phosphatase family protein [Granulicella sp. S156]|uniref:histidine phosphatase family protein n=1 Tax=Granulicella sp. S156 TaxID=1747224 RepID=UPI00131C8AE7|nr:histidine phosphatase family protein [Granulicella sp. S156]